METNIEKETENTCAHGKRRTEKGKAKMATRSEVAGSGHG